MTNSARVKELAESLLALKQRSGLSFEAMGRRLGTSGSTLHRYCSGASVPGDFRLVEGMARLCGAEPAHVKELHRLWILADAERNESAPAPESPEQEPEPAPSWWRSFFTAKKAKKAVSAVALVGAVGSAAAVWKPLIGRPETAPSPSPPPACVHNPSTTHADDFHGKRVWVGDFLCPTTPGATMVSMSDFRTPIAVMDSTPSWLLCWQTSGEKLWYYTRGDRVLRGGEQWDGWGFVSADHVQSPEHPMRGMPNC